MKIAILSPYPTFPFTQQLGCASGSFNNNATWTVTLAEHLAKLPGCEVHVVTETEEIQCSKTICADNVTIHFLKSPARFNTFTLWQFDRRRLHRVLEDIRPDIVHGQGIETQYGYSTVTSKFPFVITIHGLAKLSNPALHTPWLSRNKAVELFESYCLRKARNIIVINLFIAEFLRLIESRYRLFKIPNPVGEDFFVSTGDAREENLILSIGYVDRLKAHDVLIRALALLRRRGVTCRAVIIGPQPDARYFSSLSEYIREQKIDVEFTGFIPPEKLLPLLRRCTVLVHPSRHDNSPMSICEAMACGMPVVASRVGGVGHLVEDGKTGLLFEAANPSELADQLERLLPDAPLRKHMGARAREAAQLFHPVRVAEQTRQAYGSVLNNGSAAA
jgi:glycosyltransferase involved in cell wall biosynthesis